MEKVIIDQTIENIRLPEREDYKKFILCRRGWCSLNYNGSLFRLTVGNVAVIVTRFIDSINKSDDFQCEIIYIEQNFLRQSEPNHPYIVQGAMEMFNDPVLELSKDDQELCVQLFYNFGLRLNAKQHTFYDEILRTSTRMLVIDIFDMQSRTRKHESSSHSSADIMQRFIRMLQDKEYRTNREVAYYAKQLGVVPKYLSEISNRTSGFSASYWINRFTSYDLNQLLHKNEMTSTEISRLFHFTSTSYFNRYVKRYLGAYPNELRGQ